MTTSLSHRILSRESSPLILVARLVLAPLQLLYMLASSAKNALYDAGLLTPRNVGVPVISVGNVTVGGTGKTPLVIELARRGLAAGKKVAVVTRGYGAVADASGRSDEAKLIADRVPEALLVISPDKVLGARQAVEQGAEVIIVDDGFQHRRLHRDLDIAVVDARAPYGNGFQLPLGGLRESPAGLARADLVVLTHTENLDPGEVSAAKVRLRSCRRDLPVVHAHHRPLGVRSVTAESLDPTSHLAGLDFFLFCGIASPEAFAQTVTGLGAQVTGVMGFDDHYAFTAADLATVRSAAGTARLLCTEKDAGKVGQIPGTDDILCLAIDLEIDGELPVLPGIDG
ncbi:MAG: tetraacyldisaccharide 4'-kinase [Pseudohongiellaceae bacterium]|jgi:tetraacyldisaccharide 4'-kinase